MAYKDKIYDITASAMLQRLGFFLNEILDTVQSLFHNNKYQNLFAPTNFNLAISDEAHRSIGGNVRAAFEYFSVYKLGLTVVPKDYHRKFKQQKPTS